MFNRLEGILIVVLIIFTNSIQYIHTYFAIEQCPGTTVSNIRHQTEFNEISLIFYYTKWSNESLEALQQFNDVAAYFGDKVYFAAIDCWNLSCNCSKTLATTIGSGSPHKWPTLMMHYGRLGQLKVHYNGLFTFKDIIQFTINVMQPLERIEKRETLERIKPLTDAIVLGVFERASGLEYQNYLIASLKWLEHDPIRTYRFTITFVNAKESLNESDIESIPNIILHHHERKQSFADYSDFKWNATNILRWLHEEFNNDYSLLHGYSTPITIAQKIKKQPVLAVFVNEPQQFFSYMEKYIDYQQPFTKALLSCRNFKIKAAKSLDNLLQISEITQNLNFVVDNSKCHYYNKDFILRNLKLYFEINQYFELYYKYLISENNSLCYKANLEVYELMNFFQTTTCLQKEDIALQTSVQISVAKRLEGYLANEQHCRNSNRSLAVVLLDTKRYKDFLENIDISPTHKSMATVFIIDNDEENTYVMEDRFAMYNLMEFVKKFYSNSLNMYYKNKENIPSKLPFSSAGDFDIKLKQLNRIVFLNHLQYVHNQTLVVLIHSPDCALCGNIQHSFLQLSLSMRHIEDLKFIRINAMENDLPWQFNMPFLPALLVFPENRFTESRLFPGYLKPDTRNVFGFILSQLSAQQQIRLVLAMCQSGTLPKSNLQSCWQFARTILMQHIGKHLQYWQIFETERTLIFERLRAFKDMSLDIQRNLRL